MGQPILKTSMDVIKEMDMPLADSRLPLISFIYFLFSSLKISALVVFLF